MEDTIRVETTSRRLLRQKIDSTLMNIARRDSAQVMVLGDFRPSDHELFINRHRSRGIDSLIQKVMVSITRDTLDLERLNTYVEAELERRQIDVKHAIEFHHNHRVSRDSVQRITDGFNTEGFPENHLKVRSKSNYLPYRSGLHLLFTNETAYLLRASMFSILLSLLLSACIIASILYLFRTLFRQKQLAAVKNDLISNITHEFKTPIATISAALDAMKNFNALEDRKKSEKYLGMSQEQVGKLNIMVEKLLETATLDHGDLELDIEEVAIEELVTSVVEKYEMITPDKSFKLVVGDSETALKLDRFHFENAFGNIIDNAIKYGGDQIEITLKVKSGKVIIKVSDNGNGIHRSQKDKVFEQFYRIPTGNTHNVKGFGIGLYYTRKIVEKHGGAITIESGKKNNTCFRIELPHGN
jgi:two-component system phosphate regulon sensor histidine kinase PhoR